MRNVECAFIFLEPGEDVPIGYQKIPLHFVFDVKMDFTHKPWLVAGRKQMDPPPFLTYLSIVSHDSALNDLNILTADIGNAYLYVPTREKVYAIAGPEFGTRQGQTVIIKQALYGLKSSEAAW